MLFADIPDWLGWVLGPGGLALGAAIIWVVNLLNKQGDRRRLQFQEDQRAAKKDQEEEEKKERKNRAEDEARAIGHMQKAIDGLKLDNTDLKKEVQSLKMEMTQMRLETEKAKAEAYREARRAEEVASQNQLRAERFHMYILHLEHLLTRNKVDFDKWRENEESGVHSTTTPPKGA